MSIFATIAVVCTMATCNDYVIDTASSAVTAAAQKNAHTLQYNEVWEDEKGLTNWLNKYQVGETIFEIVSIDFETKQLNQDDIP